MGNGEIPQRWLLLLPKPPSEGFYFKALSQSLIEASHVSSRSNKTLILFVGFPFREVCSRTHVYYTLQKQYATLYQKICILTTRHAIDVENDNDVDVRVFAFSDIDLQRDVNPNVPVKTGLALLQTILCRDRQWDRVQAIGVQEEQTQIARLLAFKQSNDNSERLLVENLPSDFEPLGEDSLGHSESVQCHYSVAVGGTFDHLHVGHKLLLTMTTLRLEPSEPRDSKEVGAPRKLTIGITSDELLKKKKYREEMQDWDTRVAYVRDFVQSLQELETPSDLPKPTASIVGDISKDRTTSDIFDSGLVIDYTEIHDPFGPTVTEESISALVISGETRAGGKAVNDRRQEKGWAPLKIYEVDVLDVMEPQGEAGSGGHGNFNGKISSTDVRRRICHKKERQGAS